MVHKTTVLLPDDLHAAWKAVRLPLAEIIRRGLDGTGDTARHTAAETRLASVETRLAQLEREARSTRMFPADDDDLAEAEPVDRDELARRDAELERQEMDGRRALLLAKVPHADGEPAVVDTAAAVAAFGVGSGTARDWMKALTGYGYARQLDRPNNTGPYAWAVIEPDGGRPAGSTG